MSDSRGLVALVSKPRAEEAIESLRREGVYDENRSVAEHDEDRVAIPLREKPTETPVGALTVAALPHRRRGLVDVLRERGYAEDVIESAPSSWAVIGSVLLVDFEGPSHREAIAEALLELHGEADTVLARNGIEGKRRKPDVEIVAGVGETETVHVEDGVRYALDLSEVMFSPGNKAERVRMGEVVETDERVFDMFAGIGYFVLPMARAGADVLAAEVNPTAYRFLLENAVLNGLEARIEAVLGDCRDVDATADRVVMGHYDAHEYLESGLAALRSGGALHLHEATPEALFPDRPIGRLEDAAHTAGRRVDVLDHRVVKSYSEGVVHCVVDARVE